MGTQSVFIDNANEQHHMILLKHFTEKNHAAVVDVKTRKRKTGEEGRRRRRRSTPYALTAAMLKGTLKTAVQNACLWRQNNQRGP